jgi:geranylgeranyl diphosphate synthase type II
MPEMMKKAMNNSLRTAPPAYVVEKGRLIDAHIDRAIPPADQYPQVLHQAIRYAVLAAGKRLRPILTLAAYEACGGRSEIVYPAAVALELIHAYSLIHDDLPCMDDDDLRRGQPTVHRKFGEAVALLAGDALHDLAFQSMARTKRPEAILELAEAIGTGGMLAGQMADMEAEGRQLTLEEITFIHTRKTGRLIRGAVRIGAVLADAGPEQMQAITRYGEKIGLAFQITDDILDVEGDTDTMGKRVGSDSKNRKATFPGVVGMDESRRIAAELIEEAIAIIADAVSPPDNFIEIARFIGGRRN